MRRKRLRHPGLVAPHVIAPKKLQDIAAEAVPAREP